MNGKREMVIKLKIFKYRYEFKNIMFLKSKAIFMIIILIMSIFYISFLDIEDVNAESIVCCEKTLDSEYCGERENVNECDIGLASDENPYLTLNNYCSEASFCNTGCCVPGDGSPCGKNSVEQSCIDLGGEFVSGDSLCTTRNECTSGCCKLAPFSCGITTEIGCQQNSLLYGISSEWTPNMNEVSCTEECLQVEKGCCVTGTGILPSHFSVTTSDSCNGEFHPYMLCSNSQLASPCTEKHHTDCNPVDTVDVYWFDSCGNIENIVGVEGNGYFSDEGCGSGGNINSDSCGDCDYTLGSICDNGTMIYENAEHMCVDLNCETIHNFKSIDGSNTDIMPWDNTGKLNMQSWCIYEGMSGEGKDLVGSRHYKHTCIDGREIFEECQERRKGICIQNDETNPTEANCRMNLAGACMYCNNDDVDNKQECCDNIGDDCEYLGWPLDTCVPNYPFGTLHQEQTDGFSFDCKEGWSDGGPFSGDVCVNNCYCHEQPGFPENINRLCRSLGDFGLKYNIAGEEGESGFLISGVGDMHDKPIPMVSLGDFSSYRKMWEGLYNQFVPGYYDIEDLIETGFLPQGFDAEDLQSEASLVGGGIGLATAIIGVTGLIGGGGILGGGATGALIFGLGISNPIGWVILAVLLVAGFLTGLLLPGHFTVTYHYSCEPWEPPAGGADCSKCMEEYKICDQYRCESLGLMCHFNQEDNTCLTYDLNDAQEPIITPLTNYLQEQGYSVTQTPSNTGTDGFEIKPNNADKFNPGDIINLGINTNDPPNDLPTICKISKNLHYNGYDASGNSQTELQFFDLLTNSFGAGRSYEHTKSISYDFLDEENLNYETGENVYYIHCKDGMDEEDGGPNIKTNYWIKFNVNEVDIMTSPIINPDSYSPVDGGYITYGANNTYISFNINIPGECRYATSSKPFYEMAETVSSCSSQYLYPGVYPCNLNVPINDNTNNYFFFRCNSTNGYYNEEDQPTGGLLLKGTIPLEISSASPNNDILYTSDVTLSVNTISGAENGKAICYFSNNQDITIYNSVPFFNTNSNIHSQTLNLNPNTYNYYILCQDAGGNEALTNITFTVDTTNLTIVDVLPVNNSMIYVDNVLLQITTEGGKDNNGNSDCLYGEVNANTLITSKETVNQQTIHKKNLTNLQNKVYNYKIECNEGVKNDIYYLMFTVDMESVPSLIQVYTTYNLLNIVTDAPAICEYTNTGDFSFESGTDMATQNDYHHLANINSDVFYIKCKHVNTGLISDLYTIYI